MSDPSLSGTARRTWCYDARVQISTSVKAIQIGYAVCLLVAIGIAGYLLAIHNQDESMWALLGIPAVAALYLVSRHIQRRMVKLTILEDRLRYEAGFVSKTTRTMELSKVQDVRVDQTISQRMLNIGNLSLETAGESSRIVMSSVDRPHEAADRILELSRGRHPGV
jgi:membrane protein YdbS with pleckstrin-like domain